MEPRIVTQPAFTIIGLRYFGRSNREVPQMWDRFGPRMAEIERANGLAYGYCTQVAGAGAGEFEYVAGVVVDESAQVPEGMVKRTVPEGRFAVFATTLPTIGNTWEYIHRNWLPRMGYDRAAAADLELYDETFDPANPESPLYIYVPLS